MNEANRDEQETPWLGTVSGKKFRPFQPDPADIVIEDIAHGLAHSFRFAGQTPRGYTVAQHSLAVSREVPSEDALWGLLHDAAEAYLCDVPRPIKEYVSLAVPNVVEGRGFTMEPFTTVERWTLKAVAERFELSWPMPKSVHLADDRELARERRDLFDARQPEWPEFAVEPNPEPILICQPPEEAERLFLERFSVLLGETIPATD